MSKIIFESGVENTVLVNVDSKIVLVDFESISTCLRVNFESNFVFGLISNLKSSKLTLTENEFHSDMRIIVGKGGLFKF